jgi:hypothetical protein
MSHRLSKSIGITNSYPPVMPQVDVRIMHGWQKIPICDQLCTSPGDHVKILRFACGFRAPKIVEIVRETRF